MRTRDSDLPLDYPFDQNQEVSVSHVRVEKNGIMNRLDFQFYYLILPSYLQTDGMWHKFALYDVEILDFSIIEMNLFDLSL